VVDTTPACIKVVAADGTLLDMNAAGLAMVDAYGPEQVKGRSVYNLICPEDRDAFRAFNERVCRGEKGSLGFESWACGARCGAWRRTQPPLHGSEAGSHIPLTAERRGDEAVVTVQDTGIGISAELLPSIFDMITQGERSREHLWSGLGIGLTLVKRIVELHGSTVTAQSDGPGHGSTFIVRLPVVKAPAPLPPQVSTAAPPTVPLAPYRRLVVDDNRISAASFALLLRRMGHTLRIAHDGVERAPYISLPS
jgi:hypothetical protein